MATRITEDGTQTEIDPGAAAGPPWMCCGDCAALKSRIDQMCAAYFQLIGGGAIRVFVDSDNSRIEYTSANRGNLKADLQVLQAYYAAHCMGAAAGSPVIVTRPLNYIF